MPSSQTDVPVSADDEDLWSRVTMVPSPALGRTNEEAPPTTLDADRTVHSQVEEPTMPAIPTKRETAGDQDSEENRNTQDQRPATRRAHESLVPELTAQQLQPEDPVISALFGDRPSPRIVEEARA